MTKRERKLLLLIQCVLDCQNHFHRPDLKAAWRDEDFHLDFERTIVVCQTCVAKMRRALALRKDAHPLDSPLLSGRRKPKKN